MHVLLDRNPWNYQSLLWYCLQYKHWKRMKTWKTKSCLLINYNNLGIQATRQSKTSFRQNDLIHFICTMYCLYIVQHTKHMVQDIHAFKLNNKKKWNKYWKYIIYKFFKWLFFQFRKWLKHNNLSEPGRKWIIRMYAMPFLIRKKNGMIYAGLRPILCSAWNLTVKPGVKSEPCRTPKLIHQ